MGSEMLAQVRSSPTICGSSIYSNALADEPENVVQIQGTHQFWRVDRAAYDAPVLREWAKAPWVRILHSPPNKER